MSAAAASEKTPPARLPRHGERHRRVAESLHVGNPANHTHDLPLLAAGEGECQLELEATAIRPYEHNPRKAHNARFEEIKESIRACGMKTPLAVTRRPGESHFIAEAGGNTRLLAVQQLWAETGEARFRTLAVQFRPWRSETHVLSAHLVENELRGGMSFRDRAAGLAALKDRLEQERGTALPLRQLEQEIAALGLCASTATLSQCLFAVTRLGVLFEQVPDLSGTDVKALQPRLNLMKRYAQLHGGLPEEALYAVVFEPVFAQAAVRFRKRVWFRPQALCEACEAALAQHLGEPAGVLRLALERLSRAPLPALSGLRSDTGPPATAGDAAAPRPAEAAVSTPDEARLRSQLERFARRIGWDIAPQLGALTFVRARSVPHHGQGSMQMRARQVLEGLAGAAPAEDVASAAGIGFFEWLLGPHDAAAAEFWDTLSLLRTLRFGTPPAAAEGP